jgi:hypothetical protein
MRTLTAATILFSTQATAQVSVTTWHNDLARTGANTQETKLTPANVTASSFGKLCAYAVDGQIYAQPLYVPGLTIAGAAHNVVFVATEHDSVYAFDADCSQTGALWQSSFLGKNITTMPCTNDKQEQCDVTVMAPEHGISPTPVIDPTANTIFVAAQSVESGKYTQKLHALSLTTGAEAANSPVIIGGSAPTNPKKKFDPTQAFQRAGLLLLNGTVYVPFASNDSATGWVFGYSETTLAQQSIFCVTPNGNLGGIWGGGAAPAVDASGAIYLGTGNGSFNAEKHGANYSMSALKLAPSGSTLSVTSYFTPTNEAKLSGHDLDLDSGGLILLPGNEAVIGFKTGRMFVLNTGDLGGFGSRNAKQDILAHQGGIWSSPATWNGNLYLAGVGGPLLQWVLDNGRVPAAPTYQSATIFPYPGATPSITSNGNSNAIIWAIESTGRVQGGKPAILHAYDATNVSHELYNSAQSGHRDTAGASVKFTVPTIADGHAFVGTQTELDVYGLLPGR